MWWVVSDLMPCAVWVGLCVNLLAGRPHRDSRLWVMWGKEVRVMCMIACQGLHHCLSGCCCICKRDVNHSRHCKENTKQIQLKRLLDER